MNILVTGGCGFIGSNFARLLIKERAGWTVTVLDNLTYAASKSSIKDIFGKIRFIKCDITDKNKTAAAAKDADIIVNFAAETHVDRSIKNPEPFVRTNVFGVHSMLEAARKANAEKFVQISTDEVYGSTEKGSFKEEDRLSPANPYSATKAAGDHLVLSYANTYGLPCVVTRCSNNYGPYQYPEKLIPKAIAHALTDRPIPVYGQGKNIRDWIHVEDHCRGVLTAIEHGKKGEIYNIAGESEKTNIEIVKMILQILNRPQSLLTFVGDRPGHDFRYSIDCSKIKKLGWKRRYSFAEGLKSTVGWYRTNKVFWQAAR